MSDHSLLVNELFKSIQGESTWAGLPCAFIRLSGCPLRCTYCDTSYAFSSGERIQLQDILLQVHEIGTKLVEITGGEPLLQPNVHKLADRLLEDGYTVLLETCGERDISVCDSRICRIVDIKTPNSGAAGSFLESNYDALEQNDEVKFVILNREDFDWSIEMVRSHSLLTHVKAVHFSPVMAQDENDAIDGCSALDPVQLSNWILECKEPVRMHLQMHKYIWHPQTRGV